MEEEDDDEVVILSDVRPLEPYVVDLSEGSYISHGEDEREELLPLSEDQNLPVDGEEKRDASRGSEVEMEMMGEGRQLDGGEESDDADDDRNSARGQEDSSFLSVPVEDNKEKLISNQTDQMFVGVVNEEDEKEGGEDMELQPGEKSHDRNSDEEESPQLKLPEIPGAEETSSEIDRDCLLYAENVCKNLEECGEDFEKDCKDSDQGVEEMELEEGNEEESWQEEEENQEEDEVVANKEASNKEEIAETFLDMEKEGLKLLE